MLKILFLLLMGSGIPVAIAMADAAGLGTVETTATVPFIVAAASIDAVRAGPRGQSVGGTHHGGHHHLCPEAGALASQTVLLRERFT